MRTGWWGAPLGGAERRTLEAFYDADLADVRVHAGPFARWLTRRLRATAVALGRRIYLSPAGCEICTARDLRGIELLGHEAAHVLQYRREGLVPMLVRYVASYLRSRLRGAGHGAAYRAIPHEVEAWSASAELAGQLARSPDLAERVRAGSPPTGDELRELAAAGRRLRPRTRR